jgi:acyl carrier protein
MNDRERFVSDTLRWIRARLAPPGVTLDAGTPLFAQGILSSIKVLELIAWTERSIGRTIEDREIRLDNFRTVRRMAEAFVMEETDATR